MKQTPHFKVTTARSGAGGFSLIEVLVALVIIGIGMLGIAKLQALAYASTGTSALRSLAALQASSLASAMHANRNYWSVVPAAGFNYQFVGTTITASDSTLTGTGCTSACTAGPLAANDVQQWVAAVNSVLPNATGSIICPAINLAINPVTCAIQLRWGESNVAINAQETGNQVAPTYTLYVVP
jgi:type IV pilus assembly protein PilV